MKKIEILVAEDDLSSIILLKEFLDKEDMNITVVTDGQEAVNSCLHSQFDLVLMDMKMSEMNGYKATRLIKEFNPKLVIIGLSAYAMPDQIQKALDAGCNDYITKPISQNMFLDKLNKYLKS